MVKTVVWDKHIKLIRLVNEVAEEFDTLLWHSAVSVKSLLIDVNQVPASVGIYKFVNPSSTEVMYIGRATQHGRGGLRRRIREHIRNYQLIESGKLKFRSLYKNFRELKLCWMELGTSKDPALLASILEAALIYQEQPVCNRQLKR